MTFDLEKSIVDVINEISPEDRVNIEIGRLLKKASTVESDPRLAMLMDRSDRQRQDMLDRGMPLWSR